MYKAQLVSQYNVSPTPMGQISPKGLVMVKRWIAPKEHAIQDGM
jgi:hypothetical protein